MVDNYVVKRTVYDKLVTKINAINTKIPSTSAIVTKIQCHSDKQGLQNKIEDADKKIANTSGLVERTNHNTKIKEIKNKIPTVTGLVATAAVNTKATKIE